MIVCVAVDDANGMLFHQRRQSQDRILREHLLSLCGEKSLFVTPYTAKQFSQEQTAQLTICENPLEEAGIGEYCFIETLSVLPYLETIETLIVFKWNRRYPADFFFDVSLSAPVWALKETQEFAGFSHETITKEVYTRQVPIA